MGTGLRPSGRWVKRVRTRPIAGALLGLLLAASLPTALAQDDVREDIASRSGVPVTFYGHIFDVTTGSPMPMNTQFPINEDDFSRGFGGSCGSRMGVPLSPNEDGSNMDCGNDTLTANFWYTTAGFVQVKNADEWGSDYGKFHNERGQTKDIYLDTSTPITATYWMSADFQGWPVAACGVMCVNWDPGVLQDWVVEAWVWHASLGNWSEDPSLPPDMGVVISRDPAATLVAHGKTEPIDMQSFDGTIPAVGAKTVYDFNVELAYDAAFVSAGGVMPYDENVIVEFQWYQETDGDQYIILPPTGAAWNVNAGEDFPPKVVFPVRNPMDVELVYPRFVHDKLVVLGIINTPWGSYDIDRELTRMVVKDGKGNVVPVDPALVTDTLDSSVAHGGHYKPINATWVWDYQAQGLAPGDYTVTVETTNFQHSYTTSTTAAFTINAEGLGEASEAGRSGIQSFTDAELRAFQEASGGGASAAPTSSTPPDDDGGKGSPAPALPLAVAALAAVLLLRRRRRA